MNNTLIKALLLAGLFFSKLAIANTTWPANIDWDAGAMAADMVDSTICYGAFGESEFSLSGKKTDADCARESSKRYNQKKLDAISAMRDPQCPSQAVTKADNGWKIQDYFYDSKSGKCGMAGDTYWISVPSSVSRVETTPSCPPKTTGVPKEDAYKLKFRIKAKERARTGAEGPATMCFKPFDPIPCDALKGFGTQGTDYFITDAVDYKHPSCITIVETDKNGNRRAGNCQVIAKGWIQQPVGPYGGNMKRWTPQVGTITGVSCGFEEQKEEPPPEKKPTCWQSTNNLKMCQADPEERCTNINGVQQCEKGCGYVNGDFWCSSKDPIKPPKPPKDDKPTTDPTDEITNPDKKMADMTKGDFKDAMIGVETRISSMSTSVTNVENSIDESNTYLASIASNTEQAVEDGIATNALLNGIKTGVDKLASGDGNGDGDGEGNGECLPTDKTCNGAGTAGPRSWWKTSYPEGPEGIIERNKQAFMNSDAFKAMGGDGVISGGTGAPPSLNLCLNLGIANFGCHDLVIAPEIWTFLRTIILFMAAVYCRAIIFGK